MISTNEIIDRKLAHKKCAGHYDAETGSKIVWLKENAHRLIQIGTLKVGKVFPFLLMLSLNTINYNEILLPILRIIIKYSIIITIFLLHNLLA